MNHNKRILLHGILFIIFLISVNQNLSGQLCYRNVDLDTCKHVMFTEFQLGRQMNSYVSGMELGFNIGYLYYRTPTMGSGPYFSVSHVLGSNEVRKVLGYRLSFITKKHYEIDFSPGILQVDNSNFNDSYRSLRLSGGVMFDNQYGIYSRYDFGKENHSFSLGFRFRGKKGIILGALAYVGSALVAISRSQ